MEENLMDETNIIEDAVGRNILQSSNKGNSFARILWNFSLQARDDFCHFLDNFWIFTVAFIAATPSWISTNLHKLKEKKKTQTQWSWMFFEIYVQLIYLFCKNQNSQKQDGFMSLLPQHMEQKHKECLLLSLQEQQQHQFSSQVLAL